METTTRTDISKPTGLALCGGGAKGAFQLGAWKAMRELGISFSAVAGVSIGSINGALIAAGDYENDSEMILAAGIGAAVENAQESLKEKADIILPSCEENAIAHLIEFLEEMYD